ncbi:MAG TPA: LytTR family DNA-binding domain-containing protein [Allosphingosinicella sp.]
MERLRRIAIELFVLAAVGTVLGLLAPFGSDGLPPPWRLFFWVGFILAGYLIFRPVSAVAGWLKEETRVPPWLAILLVAVVASLPLATFIAFALAEMTGDGVFWSGNRFPLLYGQVALVGICIHLLMLLVFRAAPAPADAAPEAGMAAAGAAGHGAQAESPFLRRLPPALGPDLLSLQMQDHYVEARTALGTALILMRFRDAVAELGEAGLQVHRSWWAAFDAMEALERDGRSARLRLRGGDSLPVSRAFLPRVREALDERARGGFDRPAGTFKSTGEGGDSSPAANSGILQ